MDFDFDIGRFCGGIGIFLFSIILMEEAIKKLSGSTLRKIIRVYTDNVFKALLSGFLLTGILQSSSAVSLIVLAFVGAGLLRIPHAIGVILGINIGATLNSWIVAFLGFKFQIESFALPLVAVSGFLLIFFQKQQKISHFAKFFMGFGLLFLGLSFMKESVEQLTQTIHPSELPQYHTALYLWAGIVLSGIMQSSAPTIAMAMTVFHNQLINFSEAIMLVIGANIGTTITIILGAIAGNAFKKRTAFSHLFFNIFTAVWAIIFFRPIEMLLGLLIDAEQNPVLSIALYHTVFNLIGVLVFLPFLKLFNQFLCKIFIPKNVLTPLFIDQSTPEVVEAGLEALRKETLHLLELSMVHNLKIIHIPANDFYQGLRYAKSVYCSKTPPVTLYFDLKILYAEIIAYATQIRKTTLSSRHEDELERYLHAGRRILNATKNFKDIRHNFEELRIADSVYLRKKHHQFIKRLEQIYTTLHQTIQLDHSDEQVSLLSKSLEKIEASNEKNIHSSLKAVYLNKINSQIDITDLITVNRLFFQSCRLQALSIKDLVLPEQDIVDLEEQVAKNINK
ncbi:Na/Pi symporter [Rapidithrix thailandica]|uniref:Na/Pi symporter n=1 Tax=Rapidithrix thailandica TaxID=413964 RepID=A0AAW9SEU3_9BACT